MVNFKVPLSVLGSLRYIGIPLPLVLYSDGWIWELTTITGGSRILLGVGGGGN